MKRPCFSSAAGVCVLLSTIFGLCPSSYGAILEVDLSTSYPADISQTLGSFGPMSVELSYVDSQQFLQGSVVVEGEGAYIGNDDSSSLDHIDMTMHVTNNTNASWIGWTLATPLNGSWSAVSASIAGSLVEITPSHLYSYEFNTPLLSGQSFDFSGTLSGFGVLGGFEYTSVGYGANPDLTSISEVPLPAAGWLFGSGLLGLAGTTGRKKVT